MSKTCVRVPVVMQMEALECGSASLGMVLAYYGKWLPPERVRADCGVSRDGSSAKHLLQAARNYGLKATGYRLEPEDLRKVSFPCILHWNFNHFVVLCGFRGKHAYINDPARGTVKISLSELDECFTGVCLCFEPTEAFVKEGKPKSVLAFVRNRLSGSGAVLSFVTVLELLSAAIGIITPVFSCIFLDRVLPGENAGWLLPLLGIMAIVFGVQVALEVIQSVYMLKMQGKFAVVANMSFLWHVLRLPMRFFSQRMAGDIAMRQSTNQDIASTLMEKLAPVLLNLGMVVFYLLVMLRYSVPLTLIGLASSLINLWLMGVLAGQRINVMRTQMRDQGKLYSASVAGVEMIETIKCSGAETGYFERWSGYQAAVCAGDVRFTHINQYLGVIPALVNEIVDIAVLAVGVSLILQGHFTIGSLVAFQGFLTSFTAPFNSLLGVGQSLQEMRTSMERVEDVMQYPCDVAEQNEPPADAPSKLRGQLDMDDVSFGYSPLEKPLIEHFSLHLKPGARVALVGSSGCGKSTIAKLISGLYEPWGGAITYDGKPRADIPREVFTGSVAVVDQDVTLFEDTIAENIRLWDHTIEDYEVIMAARDADIHEDIMQRPDGYGSRLSENGSTLSGGQRQRLEIARVLAADPTVVILDEATSALDAVTEHNVVEAIAERDITCVIVAHRLSTIRDCDEIIVLDNGHIVDRGTHEELYKRGGLYTRLISAE